MRLATGAVVARRGGEVRCAARPPPTAMGASQRTRNLLQPSPPPLGRGWQGKGGIMEGRYPNGLLLAITNCTDPSKEAEFNAWYNHMHVPDVTAPGIFRHALRFVNSDPSSPAGQYIATYETTWEDGAKAIATNREAGASRRERGDRSSPYIQPVTVGVCKRVGGEFSAARRPT